MVTRILYKEEKKMEKHFVFYSFHELQNKSQSKKLNLCFVLVLLDLYEFMQKFWNHLNNVTFDYFDYKIPAKTLLC